MRKHYTLDVELTLTGPLLTCGGEMSDPGIDAPMARDWLGRFMLPFSLVKGKVLDALTEIKSTEFEPHMQLQRFFPKNGQLGDWLGRPSAGGSYDPERGRLRFGDLHTDQSGTGDDAVINRIKLNAAKGTVSKRMLQMVQAPFGYDEPVLFRGSIQFIAEQVEAKQIEKVLDQALRWVPAYGAYRTVGFGRTKEVKTTLKPTPTRATGRPADGSILPFRIRLDRPLCLVGRKHSRNHFESEEVMSGAVLKGSTARLLLELTGSGERFVDNKAGGEFPKLREHFAEIRFAEARPMDADASVRPVEPPLSVVTSPAENMKGEYFDVALEEKSRLIGEAAPAFAPDWKDAEIGLVRSTFGWPVLPRERRTRTAINPHTSRAADEQLFSYGLVLPGKKTDGGTIAEFVWEGSIGLEGIPEKVDQDKVREELDTLLQYGFINIGKTRAVGEVQWLENPTPNAVDTTAVATDHVIVTLQTDCLMTDPDLLQGGQPGCLKRAYEAFWCEISDGALSLKRYFARQSLSGGFLSQRSNSITYEPFLLTDRGSVFVLTIVDSAKANGDNKGDKGLLDRWAIQGLPLADWVKRRYAPGGEPLWKRCPFLPEVGYGEIAINLACHTLNRIPNVNPTAGD
jgi:hypothetical protein